MAEVFEAELTGELGFARKVAIKRMLDDAAADPGAAGRFLDEARIASRLHHANIVAVTDVGLLDGLPFQVLELVDGINAQQLLQRAGGALPLEVALAIAGEVAHALDHAHTAVDAAGVVLGVVHRDVKPSNILVSWAGDVKLADFGIALARDRSSRTETGMVAGTLGFMAPEQRTRAEVDGRADVFALGLTLHALITGTSPMQEPGVELAAIAGQPIPLAPGLPDDVHRLIARALAPARLDRPDAARLAHELGAALAPRLVRDARSVIRGFVEPFAAKRPAAGALDHLLGVEVVPLEHAPGEVPRYHTVATAAPRARPDAVTVRKPDAVGAPAPPSPLQVGPPQHAEPPAQGRARAGAVPPARRGRRLAALSVAALALGLGGAGLWRLAGPGGAIAPASAPPPTDAAPVLASAAADAPPDAAILPPAPPDAPAAAPAIDAPVPDATPRLPDRSGPDAGRRGTAIRRPPPRPDAAPPPEETGWLLVYGDELVGSRVIVDGGRWTGSVPNPIEVSSFHSPNRPLRITW
jgi:hypothetical protein